MPETKEGIWIRRLMVAVYGTVTMISAPLRILAVLVFGRVSKTLYYFHDLDVSPITFDIADYLVIAEMERRRRGFDHIYIYIVPGRSRGLRDEGEEYEKLVGRSNRLWRLNNLVIPTLALLPSCSGYSFCKDRRQATLFRIFAWGYTFPPTYWPAFPVGLFRRPILEAARHGASIFPIFSSPIQSLTYVQQWLSARIGTKKAISITLRSYGFDPTRNSNLAAWAAFARSLNQEEFAPIFVLDTDTAMDAVPEAIKDFLVFHEAPWNLALRSALYELAYLNLAIVHGPTALLWYNDRCRYVIFFPQGGSSRTDPDYVRANGFIRGESLPFATPFQKWVWEPDDLSAIRQEFTRMCDAIECKSGSTDRELNPG